MHFVSPVRVGGFVYGCSDPDPGFLTCLDLRSGEVRWKQRGFGKGTVLAAGTVLFVLGDQGKLAVVEANPEEYVEKARWQPFRGRTWTMPTLAGGRLYLRNEEEVLCLDVSKR
jgi:hypothetical protein